MKIILLVVLFISLAIVFAEETVSNVAIPKTSTEIENAPKSCNCKHTSSNGTVTNYNCIQDEVTKKFFCPSFFAKQNKRGDDEEGRNRRPGPGHDDDEDEWRNNRPNRPGYYGRPDRPERPRLPNLIKNGGFETGTFNDWTEIEVTVFGTRLGTWEIQPKTHYFANEIDIPFPPEGQQAAVVSPATLLTTVGLFQDVDISSFSACTAIKFELSFKYIYRNYDNDFDITISGFLDTLQMFSASIHRTTSNILNIIPLHVAFITQPGSPKSTGNEYIKHKSEFVVSNAVGSTPLSSIRVAFAQLSAARLFFGVDDVELTGRCINI